MNTTCLQPSTTHSDPTAAGWRILLASGSSIEQKFAAGILTKHGHHVVIAATCDGAVAQAAAEHWDAVLIDSWLADVPGSDLCRTIRQQQPANGRRPAVLVMREGQEDSAASADSGADGVLCKPLHIAEFTECMRRVLAASGAATCQLEAVDWCEVLESIGGDRGLLDELLTIFFEEYPPTLREIGAAIEQQSAKRLQLNAHKLKGCLRYFGDTAAGRRAKQLEDMGRCGQLEGAPAEFQQLEADLERLLPVLRLGPPK